jgi:hypothetical protein
MNWVRVFSTFDHFQNDIYAKTPFGPEKNDWLNMSDILAAFIPYAKQSLRRRE